MSNTEKLNTYIPEVGDRVKLYHPDGDKIGIIMENYGKNGPRTFIPEAYRLQIDCSDGTCISGSFFPEHLQKLPPVIDAIDATLLTAGEYVFNLDNYLIYRIVEVYDTNPKILRLHRVVMKGVIFVNSKEPAFNCRAKSMRLSDKVGFYLRQHYSHLYEAYFNDFISHKIKS